MKTGPIAVIGLACLLLSGCRTDPAIQLLERDNRRLEDEIYRLRACLDDYESGMITTGGELAAARPVRRRDRDEDRQSSAAVSRNHDLPPGATMAEPSVEMLQTPENEVQEIRPRSNPPPRSPAPATRAPGAFQPPRSPRAMPAAESTGPSLGAAEEDDLTPPSVPADNISYIPPPKGDSFQAVQIVMHDRLCTASQADGIRVVFEARDRQNRRVDAPADVSIVLVDPKLKPPGSDITPREAKIARWDFPADAVASMFRSINGRNAICIEAPWPDQTPQQQELLLFVRYKTRDGRDLIAGNLPIVIKRPQDRTTRARPPQRLQPAVEEAPSPTLAQNEPPPAEEESPPADMSETSPPPRRDSLRTATREDAPRLQRPVWSPDRR